MRYIYNISKLAVIFNCLLFISYYFLQFMTLVGCIFFEFDILSINVHNIPFFHFASEVESGIFLSLPSKTVIFEFFTFPMLLYVGLALGQIGIIKTVKRFNRNGNQTQGISIVFIIFIILFFFDKRAMIGLLGSMGLLLVLRAKESKASEFKEYSFLFGRFALLVAIATEIGDISYHIIESFFSSTVLLSDIDPNHYTELGQQIIPDPIVNIFTYLLGTILFLLGLLLVRAIITNTVQKKMRPSIIILLYCFGSITILNQPFFGAFFIVSAICFTFSLSESEQFWQRIIEICKLEPEITEKN
ncbi:MAG: hypothetical protein ACRC5Q_01720 [Culicoidibacterales bacterium]